MGKGETETIAEVIHEANKKDRASFVSEDKKAMTLAIREKQDIREIAMLLLEACVSGKITEEEFDQDIIAFDSFHKLSLIRIAELRRYLQMIKKKLLSEA